MKLSMVLFALASQTQAMRLCNFFCPMMLDEVCGTDGQTYGKSGLKFCEPLDKGSSRRYKIKKA